MDKLKVAVISCGMITNKAHIPAYKAYPDKCEVVAVSDLNEDVTRQFQQIFEEDRDFRCTELTQENFKSRFSLRRRIIGRTMGTIKFFM